jgi:large subunit ribosomal protein L9
MELILLEKVQNLGDLGDRVDVKPGFGRNYLVPQGMAVRATKANVEHFEARREELERKAAEKLGTAEARLTALKNIEAEFTVIASAEGKLYGSVGPREIAEYLTSKGYPVEKSEVIMSEGAIRHIGHYDVTLQLHADVISTMHVVVSPEDGPVPIMEELFEDESEATETEAAEETAEAVAEEAEEVEVVDEEVDEEAVEAAADTSDEETEQAAESTEEEVSEESDKDS